MTMTMDDARAALNVPADTANNNCVQDGQWRLREAIKLAEHCEWAGDDLAPSYVETAVRGLQSWIDHHYQTRAARGQRITAAKLFANPSSWMK